LPAGFFAFLVAIVFIFFVQLNFGIFIFSEVDGIMRSGGTIVNGRREFIHQPVPKLISCY
jgi:hypothetical protein